MFVDGCDLSPPDRGWNYEPARAELLQKISASVYTTDVEGWLTYWFGLVPGGAGDGSG